jgi:hypothetical protein
MSILDHVRIAPLVVRTRPLVCEHNGRKHVVDLLHCFSPQVLSAKRPDVVNIGIQDGILADGRDVVDPSLTSPDSVTVPAEKRSWQE